MHHFMDALTKYAVFSGRATRQQYWMYSLFYLIFYLLFSLLDLWFSVYNASIGLGMISGMFAVAMALPSLAILIRRLHDIGKTGWWVLILFIPIIGALVTLIFLLLDSEKQQNQYGESLKYPENAKSSEWATGV